MSALRDLCRRFWDWRLRDTPEFATFCGFHQYDSLLADMTEEAFMRRKEDCARFLKESSQIDESELSEKEQLTCILLKDQLETFVNNQKYQGYLNQINFMVGIHVDFELFISWMKFNSVEDFQVYVQRLKALPSRVEQTIAVLRMAISRNKTLNAHSLGGVLDMIEALCKDPESTVFMQPFIQNKGIPEIDLAKVKNNAVLVIKNEVSPAFRQLETFLVEEYMKHLRPEVGISSWTDGREFYEASLKYHISVGMSPEQVHQLGLAEVSRIRKEMQQVMESTNFKGDFKAFVADLRSNPKFYFSSKEEILEGLRDICYKQIRPRLHKLFHKIPDSLLKIEAAPASQPNAPAGFYLAGTLDGSRPGVYHINCNNVKHCPKYELMSLSLHEGEPGHHFQGMYAIEMKELPSFQRYCEDLNYWSFPSRFPLYAAYMEGWGLYCEYLGKELGLYEDPYSLFGHLSFEMMRACRLVADTGIHALGWSHEQAVALFLENTATVEAVIQHEVDRYITIPGQACAYKIGMLKIQELRRKASQALGSLFDVRDFHDEVLSCGMAPMHVLETVIDKYIAKKQNLQK